MTKFIKAYTTLFIFIFLAFSANSQIVNVEKKRKDNKTGFQGTANFEFSARNTGNKLFELKNNIDLQYNNNQNTVILINNIKYLRLDKGNLINDGFIHLRYNYNLPDTSFITIETFGQAQYNANKLLSERFLYGAGARFKIFDNPKLKFYTASLAMYEYEQLSDSINSLSKLVRLDLYTTANFSINNKFSLNLIAYYQPAFNNFSDFRVSGEINSRFSFTKNFALDVGYSADYDSKPPEDIQNLFYNFRTKFAFMF